VKWNSKSFIKFEKQAIRKSETRKQQAQKQATRKFRKKQVQIRVKTARLATLISVSFSQCVQEINWRLKVLTSDYRNMIITHRQVFPASGFGIINWIVSTVIREACLWDCTWRHFVCLNSGMWYHVQIRKKFGQMFKNTQKRAAKPPENGQIFIICP